MRDEETPRSAPPPRTMSWKEAMQMPAGSQMQYLRALIESRPMLTRIPDQWLIADPMGTADRIQACRASDGSYAFIYTATGANCQYALWTASMKSYPELRSRRMYDPRLRHRNTHRGLCKDGGPPVHAAF